MFLCICIYTRETARYKCWVPRAPHEGCHRRKPPPSAAEKKNWGAIGSPSGLKTSAGP